MLDGFRTADDDREVGDPEDKETEDLAHTAQRRPAVEHRRQHQVNRNTAEQGLDAEPAAGDDCADQRRYVRADDAERGAHDDRAGNAVAGSGIRIERQRDQDDDIRDQDGPQSFRHGQAEVGREDAAQRVSRYADGHAHPQRRNVPARPGSL